MNPDVLEKVLRSDRLPSLPAVAARLIELTRQEAVSFKDLAETIQNDQALAAKVLRTVNSSLFGLRKKCGNINQAIVMLGLSAVKSLALGFSLVGAIKDCHIEGLDMPAHWRRALYTGVAAKHIAAKAGIGQEDECFLGGLLQDVGVIALHQALGEEYDEAIAGAEGDHRRVATVELETFHVQHPDIGALLAQRWKLPEELVMPIKYHEKPTAAPSAFGPICRAVGLGNIAADLLASSDPTPLLKKFYEKAQQWFGLSSTDADEVLEAISTSARQVARYLTVPTGQTPDAQAILATARQQLSAIEITNEANTPPPVNCIPEPSIAIDELTGLASRVRFERTMIAAFEQAQVADRALAVAIFSIDRHAETHTNLGRDSADNVLVVAAGRVERALAPTRGLVARYGDSSVALVLPRTTRVDAVRACEAARVAVASDPIKLFTGPIGSPPSVAATLSIGLAVLDVATIQRFDDVGAVLSIVEQAVSAANKAGGNTIRVYAPGVPAAPLTPAAAGQPCAAGAGTPAVPCGHPPVSPR